MSNTNTNLATAAAAALGLKAGFTDADFQAALTNFATKLTARKAALSLPASASITQINSAEAARRSAAAMATQMATSAGEFHNVRGNLLRVNGNAKLTRNAGSVTPRVASGPKLLSREEAQDISVFGAGSRIDRRRQEATEDHFGMTLIDALRGGLL